MMAPSGRGAWRGIAAIAMLVAGLLSAPTAGNAQSLPGLPLSSPAPNASALDALFASTPIVLDGTALFRIAVPAANGSATIASRANTVNVALDQIVTTTGSAGTAFDPRTLHVEIVREGSAVVLEAVDEHHASGVPIVTVTSDDAAYHQTNIDALAQQWQTILQTALVAALDIRQPETVRKNTTAVAVLAGAGALVTLGVWLFALWLSRRIAATRREIEAHAAAVSAERSDELAADDPAESAEHHRRVLRLLVRRNDPQRRITLWRGIQLIVVALTVLGWFGILTWSLLQFPQTVPAGTALLHNGFAITAIWVVTLLLDRALTIAVDRLPVLWELRHYGTAEEQQRQLLRAPTIARALGGLKTFLLIFVAALATLARVGIPVGSVVTIGSVAALAVSLAAQNLIRDVVSGFLVLIEDQFVVGDFVTINGSLGTVERLTLRMVQIRDATGSLVTISHSAATSVVNHSRNWSRVDYTVSIDPAADVNAAIELVREQIDALQHDAEWKGAIVEPPEWIGIESISRDGAIIRARIKTAPLRQFALQRELNARVLRAFGGAHIAFGAPAPPTTP